jgi:hypothetical protein
MLLRDFMMRPENNRYKYDYQVNKTSDVTPVDEEMLEPVNAYIPDNAIVNLISLPCTKPVMKLGGTTVFSICKRPRLCSFDALHGSIQRIKRFGDASNLDR